MYLSMYVYLECVRDYMFKNMYKRMYVYLERVWVVKDRVRMYALMIMVLCSVFICMR